MTVHACSLVTFGPQSIPPSVYTIVRFSYEPISGESYDPDGMHESVQPDGGTSVYPDERSGLIWPMESAWGLITGIVHLEAGGYTEVRTRLERDPLDLTTGPDSTWTQDKAPTPGGQYGPATAWQGFVHPSTPWSLQVRHNAPAAIELIHAQFKLSYHVG